MSNSNSAGSKQKVYIVLSPSWEYNDEYHHAGKGSNVNRVFTDKTEAQALSDKLKTQDIQTILDGSMYVEDLPAEVREVIPNWRDKNPAPKEKTEEARKVMWSHWSMNGHCVKEMEVV